MHKSPGWEHRFPPVAAAHGTDPARSVTLRRSHPANTGGLR